MKRFLICSIIVITIYPLQVYSQLLFDENFSYETGLLNTVSGGKWFKFSTIGTKNIEVLEGNLSYPGYVSSEGRYILLEGVSSVQWLQRYCDSTYSGSIYISFLMSLKNILNLYTSDGYFFSINNVENNPKLHISIKKNSSDSFQLGIRKGTYPVYADSFFTVNETILVVIKYTFTPDLMNDSVFFWINPPLTISEPTPDIIYNKDADFSAITGVTLRPSSNTGNIYIDGIRIAKNWEQAPLPVQLSSFSAVKKGDEVFLKWKTETEIDNYGFDIERKIVSEYKNEDWKKIAFIRGYGNSNAPRQYSFIDKETYNYSSYFYRLKQRDNNGSYTYSDEINVEIINPSPLTLYQNYPNPFNPETTLKFSIPYDGYVNIILYNIIGQKVKEVASGTYKKGDYSININSDGLSSGIYFCLLESGNQKKTIKMVISN
ncbi:MAG: T9SS C-terminal target domain-containing protein [Ignavibacteriales bacterium]|nr:MAG: T9SS C-terminal target domain-containing protein [Ignavibacteriales bacterium]